MTKKIILLLFLGISLGIKAQYTEVINSNRPGFSESPYSVGSGIYQLESGLFYSKMPESASIPNSFGANLLFRTSFLLEKLEFNFSTKLQQDEIRDVSSFGFSAFTIGAKYLIYQPTYTDKSKEIRSWKKRFAFDWKRLIPHIAVYGGVNVGNFITKMHKRNGFTPKVGILLQNNITSNFNLITNLYYDYITSDIPELSFIITGTYNFDIRWSSFLEGQMASDKYNTHSNLGLGIAYLYMPDLQLHISVRSLFQDNITGFYTGLGVSYRINRHRDRIKRDSSDEKSKLKEKSKHKDKDKKQSAEKEKLKEKLKQ